jgi:hypothetical protein
VLFSFSTNEGDYVCTSPLCKRIDSFNKYSRACFLSPITTKNNHELGFFKLLDVSIKSVSNTHHYYNEIDRSVIGKLDEKVMNRLIEKTKVCNKDNLTAEYKRIKLMLEYISLFDKLDKQARKNIRREHKQKTRSLVASY